MVADFAPRFGVVDLACVQDRLVHEIQFAVAEESWAGEVIAADDIDNRVQVIEQRLCITVAAVEQVAFGVQKLAATAVIRGMPQVEPDRYVIAVQEANQVLDQPQGGGGERLGVEFVPQVGHRIGTQSDVFAGLRFVTQQLVGVSHNAGRT